MGRTLIDRGEKIPWQVIARDESDRSFSYNSMSGTAFETDFTAFGAGTCGGVYDAACMSRFQAASIRSDLIHSAVFAVEAATPWGTIVDGYECASQPRVSACLAAAISLVPTGTILRAGGKLFIKTGPEFVPTTQELVEVATSAATNRTLDDIIAGGQRLPSTGGRTTQIQKTGGVDQANADFDALGLNNVRDIIMPNGETGRVGELPDGTRVVVRSTSSDRVAGHTSQSTLEIQRPDGPTKIRY